MATFLTVKEAAKLTGKSTSSIRRVIYPIIHDDAHADRSHILPSVEEALAYPYSDAERASIMRNRSRLFVGSPATVMQKLQPMIAASQADELMVITAVYDHDARKKSYSLLADAFGLAKKAAA